MFQDNNVVFSFRGPMGVRIDIGQSILFLIGFLIFLNLNGNLMFTLVVIAMLLVSILLHELGHAWGAIVQGIPAQRILLYGGGGLFWPARSGTQREAEFITATGPLVNLALWALAGIAQYIVYWQMAGATLTADTDFDLWLAQNRMAFDLVNWIGIFGYINLALFIFALIPVQPMDGGKLFHHMMLRLFPPPTAQRITGGVGLVVSVLWIPAAIYLFVTFGFILFFFPSIPLHWAMFQGRAAF